MMGENNFIGGVKRGSKNLARTDSGWLVCTASSLFFLSIEGDAAC